MKFKNFIFLFHDFLLTILMALVLCSCSETSEEPKEPVSEKMELAITIAAPSDGSMSAELTGWNSQEALERVWMGLFSSDGNLKREFRLGNGISLIDGKMNLNLTRGLVGGGDILAVVKHTASAISKLEISSLEELRNVEFSVEDIQKSESEVLYAEKTLTEEECRIGKILELNLSRPFAEIAITDSTDNIKSISMNSCPSTGRLGDALILKPSFLDTRPVSEVAGQEFMSDGDGNFHLYVPYIKFASNEAKSDDRALTLSLNNGTTSTIYLTRHEDGKPVDIMDTDSTWQALWPGCRYTFKYNVAVEEEPKFEIKDKIRIIWYNTAYFGKFSGDEIKIDGNPLNDRPIPIGSYVYNDFIISDEFRNNPLYYCKRSTDKISVTSNLLRDAYETRDIIINKEDFTEIILCGEPVVKPEYVFRFFCRDDNGYEFESIILEGYSSNPIKLEEDKKRGYKYVDFPDCPTESLELILICKDNRKISVMEYCEEYCWNPAAKYSFGLDIAENCVREFWDGEWYECFYLN